jgi:hypothetical protein
MKSSASGSPRCRLVIPLRRCLPLAGLLAVAVLAGCGGSSGAAPPETDGGAASGASGSGTGGGGGPPGSGGASATGGNPGSASGGTGSGGRAASGGRAGDPGTSTGGVAPVGSGGAAGGAGAAAGGTDACGRPAAIALPTGYTRLAWHDEFEVDGAPSSLSWGYETGFVRNEELQWYQPQNAQVSGGLLTITAKKESQANPNYRAGSSDWKTNRQNASYTSSSMTTSGKQSWQYGRFEMCAKIPIAAGMWPAWWTLGVSGEWPTNGEIDIMEFYKGKILANVACGTSTRWTAKWDSATKSVDAAWAAKFHVWRMDWSSTQIDLYVDDTLLNTAKLSDVLNADGKSPFMQKAYMIVNLALGGANGGDPAATAFPQTYQIDYLRVFE